MQKIERKNKWIRQECLHCKSCLMMFVITWKMARNFGMLERFKNCLDNLSGDGSQKRLKELK